VGLLSLAGGLFLKFGLPSVIDHATAFLPVPPGSSGDDDAATPVPAAAAARDITLSDLTPTLNVAVIVLLALGVFMTVVGVAGCAGACCSVRLLLAPVRFVVSKSSTAQCQPVIESVIYLPKSTKQRCIADSAPVSQCQSLTYWKRK